MLAMAYLGMAAAQQAPNKPVNDQQSQQQALTLQQLLVREHSCSSHSHKCHSICEASNQLKNAADDLARCASANDYNDSCDRQFRDVRDAHDELENTISDSDGDCD